MTPTNFPNGISSFGVPVLGGAILTTGSIFFVDSNTGNDGNSGKTPRTALATIDAAIGLCTANKGDYVICMPGHSETLTGAGAITADIAGVTVLGLGSGSVRPTLTLSTTATTILVSAANVTFRNLRTTTSADELVKVFNIQASHCVLDAVDFFETSTKQAISFLLTNSSATDLTVMNCVHRQMTAPAANGKWIELVAADRAKILNNTFHLTTTSNSASNVIGGTTTESLNVLIQGNTIVHLGGTAVVAISLLTNTTGFVRQNYTYSSKTAIAGTHALASCGCSENYASNTANAQGILEPVADS